MALADVALSAYGKPFQTAVTLASLLEHSGRHIGTIYFSEERNQPEGWPVGVVPGCFPRVRFEHVIPARCHGWGPNDPSDLLSPASRRALRYQYAWERSQQRFLFVTHNDCLYHSDAVGGMLDRLADGVFSAVGQIGQCWNCPACAAAACSGARYERYRPGYAELERLLQEFPSARTGLEHIDTAQPWPLPECRLNEFGCLIDLVRCRPDVMPMGEVRPLGYMGLDTGTDWFRGLALRGHRFLHWFEGVRHAPFSGRGNGHDADLDPAEYAQSERRARAYLSAHYPEVLGRLELLAGEALV